MQTVRRAQACGIQEPLRLCIWADWSPDPQGPEAVMAAGAAAWPGSNHWRESSVGLESADLPLALASLLFSFARISY